MLLPDGKLMRLVRRILLCIFCRPKRCPLRSTTLPLYFFSFLEVPSLQVLELVPFYIYGSFFVGGDEFVCNALVEFRHTSFFRPCDVFGFEAIVLTVPKCCW